MQTEAVRRQILDTAQQYDERGYRREPAAASSPVVTIKLTHYPEFD
jgi:hypothetical protein